MRRAPSRGHARRARVRRAAGARYPAAMASVAGGALHEQLKAMRPAGGRARGRRRGGERNEKIAAAAGRTVDDFNAVPVTRAAIDVVYDALAESRASLIPPATLDARKILGAGPIKFLHDKASCYQAIVSEGDLCGFDAIEMAAGKAPDMSHLDAGVCKVIEDLVEAEGAETVEVIRKAVRKA